MPIPISNNEELIRHIEANRERLVVILFSGSWVEQTCIQVEQLLLIQEECELDASFFKVYKEDSFIHSFLVHMYID